MKRYLILLFLLIPALLLSGEVDYKGNYLLNSPTINNLAIGSGYYFDGVNDYVNCGNGESVNITDAFTVSAWVKFPDYTQDGGIVDKCDGFGTSMGYTLRLGSNRIYFQTSNGIDFTYDQIILNSSYENKWIMITGVYDGTNGRLYVNGNLEDTDPFVHPQIVSNPLTIGALFGGSSYRFNGSIAKARIWNRALSADEIKDDYSKQSIQYKDEIVNSGELFTTEIDRTFTGGATHWTNYDYATFTEVDSLSLTASAEKQYCYITFTDIGTDLVKDKQYKLTYDYSEITTGFQFKLGGATGQTLGDAIEGTGQTIEFTAVENYATTDELMIEASTDLADGDFDNFSLKELGCVGNWNSSGVGHNQWIDNSINENNGTVYGAIPTNLPVDDTQVLVLKNITGETTKTNWLPKGYAIKSIAYERGDDAIDNFNIGFTDGGGEIVANIMLGTSSQTGSFTILQGVDDLDNDDTFYISADVDGWNTYIDLYITIQRVVIK